MKEDEGKWRMDRHGGLHPDKIKFIRYIYIHIRKKDEKRKAKEDEGK